MITAEQFINLMDSSLERKDCIVVRRNGRDHIRRYKHPIKTGMNIHDLMDRPDRTTAKYIDERIAGT